MFKTIKNFSVTGKRVLLRCDFNVPINESGDILDDFRIRQALPTIKYLIDQKAKIILMSHLGEPEGKVVPELKMDKVAQKLSDLLNFPIGKTDNCIGPEIENEANALNAGGILMLENLRFYKEETLPDDEFAKKLSYLGDFYVNDAFSVCHRNNASVSLLSNFLPYCAGFLLEKEINSLDKILKNPEQPMVVVIGGKKVSTKDKFINNVSKLANCVIIGGLMAKEINEEKIKLEYPEKIIFPTGDLGAMDINDESIKIFQEKIMQAKTVLWNGPFGKFEDKNYEKGTLAIANAIIASKAFSVVGGGETVEFLDKKSIINSFSHVSTGGGAMLSYLAGDELPGIKALE